MSEETLEVQPSGDGTPGTTAPQEPPTGATPQDPPNVGGSTPGTVTPQEPPVTDGGAGTTQPQEPPVPEPRPAKLPTSGDPISAADCIMVPRHLVEAAATCHVMDASKRNVISRELQELL